jgi:hypothetical protein
MTRLIISIACATGSSPDDWIGQDWRTIATAVDLLKDTSKDDPEGRQMSG